MFRILAVDDNEDVLSLIRRAGQAAGHEVETANSGEAFKAAFVRLRPNVVIVDIRMPDIGGVEIIRWLADTGSPPRVILISGDPVGNHGKIAGELAAISGRPDVAMLPKPFRIVELLKAIGGNQDPTDRE